MQPTRFVPTRARGSARRRPRAFTLLETALTTVIIGVGVLAVVEAQQAFLERNTWSTTMATAAYLGNEIREMTQGFPRHDRFSGGLYYAVPGDPTSFAGWGPEAGETIIADLDDLDDLDGAVFGDATNLPAGFTMTRRYAGPVSAFGQVIPETLYDGTTETFIPAGSTVPVPVSMRGWTQIVQVDKVNPYDLGQLLADNAQTVVGAQVMRAVNQYPVRVTVTVLYQPDPNQPAAPSTSITWIEMP